MKRHAFDTYKFTHNPDRLTHRHLPTLRRFFGSMLWTFMHLFMPWMVHYLTDKYKGRLHHVVVDTIYAAVTMTLVFANIGIGIWYYLYFTPADIDVKVQTKTQVVSGEPMDIVLTYANPYRDIRNVHIRAELPNGFIAATGGEHATVEFNVGDVDKHVVEQLPITGIVFGSVGQQYTVRVITSYEYLGRSQEVVNYHHFTVRDSSFDVSVDLPSTAVYGRQTEGVIRYTNRSAIARKNIEMKLVLPQHFVLTDVLSGNSSLYFSRANQAITVSRVEPEERGEIRIQGYFSFARAEQHQLNGDQQTEIGVETRAAVDSKLIKSDEQFTQPLVSGTIQVVNPRATLALESPRAVYYGDAIVHSVIVRNDGDTPITQIALAAQATGEATAIRNTTVTVSRGGAVIAQRTQSLEGSVLLPEVDRLEKGERIVYTVRIPTVSRDLHNAAATFRVTGSVYAPEIGTSIPLIPVDSTTKFNSQIDMDTRSLFYTPEGDQIGYGPFPPQAWNATSLRVILGLQNRNNAITNVRVTARLNGQSRWTDFYSVSAGTTMSYNPINRMIVWTIEDLPPQSQRYGGQFEILFTPNHLQVGLKPNLLDSVTVTARDAWTGESLRIDRGRLESPASVAPDNGGGE